jgi:glycosyltransferase involved in cell wall biosynthesis
MSRPGVLLLTKGLGRGGAEHIVSSSALLGNRDRYRYEVAYLLPSKTAFVDELTTGGVAVHCLGSQPFEWMGRLRQLVAARALEIVHAHSPVPSVGLRLQNLGSRRPLVYTEHNTWSRYHPATRWANAVTFARNDYVFAVSQDVRRSITSSTLGRSCTRLETLIHGIAPNFACNWETTDGVREEFGIDAEVPLVVCIANFKRDKGHSHLLRAAAIVRRLHPAVRFLLAGVGAHEKSAKSLSSQLGLNRTVLFAGFRNDAPRLIAAADLFVLPSEREGLPIALLEAMALGRATIATNVGGIPDVISTGLEGVLVPPASAPQLAEQIISLLDDPSKRARMGAAGRVRASDFDIRRAIHRMEDIYEELLA